MRRALQRAGVRGGCHPGGQAEHPRASSPGGVWWDGMRGARQAPHKA